MAFRDPRSCLLDFFQTGRNIGRRPPSLSLRNVQRDINAAKTRIENIGTRIEGAIGAASRGEFLPGQVLSIANEFRCPPTPYPSYFSQHRPPKFKFMFFATLKIHPNLENAFKSGSTDAGEVWWFIKQSGRPNVSYDWEEINKYNFRTKVLRRATLEPISIQLYDDLQDTSHGFWNTFIRLQNPITNIGILKNPNLEDTGMDWSADRLQQNIPTRLDNDLSNFFENTFAGNVLGGFIGNEEVESVTQLANAPSKTISYGASTGVLPGTESPKNVLTEIQLHHIIDWGRQIVTYTFVNPRITEIRLDELTWESSEPNVIDVVFDYDAFDIAYPNAFTEEDTTSNKIPPVYPIVPQYDVQPGKVLGKTASALGVGKSKIAGIKPG